MNMLVACILSIIIVVILVAPKKWALLGLMAGVLYLPQHQVAEVASFSLFPTRFLEIAGFMRVVLRREFSFKNFNSIDSSFIILYCFTAIIFLLRSDQGQAYMVGTSLDYILSYFTCRGLINSVQDFKWFLHSFVILLIPYTMIVLKESITSENLFGYLGGYIEPIFYREGRPRCMGSFRHPALLGTLGATFVPIYIGMLYSKLDRKIALVGLIVCTLIVWASNSGGPLSAYAFGIICWFIWPYRDNMALVRKSLACAILLLALVMKAPIWYLPAKLSQITGGDGWHRSYLIDVSLQHLQEWWLAGMPISETSTWFGYVIVETGGADITNVFISFGLNAGIIAILLFILLLIKAFGLIGNALAKIRKATPEQKELEYFLWGIGVMLSTHISTWFGITYFDQTFMIWTMHLAMISSLTHLIISCSEEQTSPPLTNSRLG